MGSTYKNIQKYMEYMNIHEEYTKYRMYKYAHIRNENEIKYGHMYFSGGYFRPFMNKS